MNIVLYASFCIPSSLEVHVAIEFAILAILLTLGIESDLWLAVTVWPQYSKTAFIAWLADI